MAARLKILLDGRAAAEGGRRRCLRPAGWLYRAVPKHPTHFSEPERMSSMSIVSHLARLWRTQQCRLRHGHFYPSCLVLDPSWKVLTTWAMSTFALNHNWCVCGVSQECRVHTHPAGGRREASGPENPIQVSRKNRWSNEGAVHGECEWLDPQSPRH